MPMAAIKDEGLLERQRELSVFDGLVDVVTAGTGGLAVVSGPAGIGKSSLVAAARRRARRRGIVVLAARGEEIEQQFAYGVARQLFERAAGARLAAGTLAGAAALATVPLGLSPAPKPRPRDEGFASRHGLYWLAADLAAEVPLLLAIDDAQWADLPSLEWLAFLAARLDELPIALVVALRDEGDLQPTLAKLESERMAERIVPRPLSEAAVARMTRAILEMDPQPELVAAVYRAAGGNPLWTRELLRALAADDPTTPSLDVRQLADTTPLSVTRTVLVRLGQLGPEAVKLARAVAALGSEVDRGDAAAVAGLDSLAVDQVAGVLARAGIFVAGDKRLSFSHPIVRESIYADLSDAQRASAHAAAAETLAARDAPPEQIATHLLLVPPGDEPRITERLYQAARAAVARGAPKSAVAYLRRAHIEQPADGTGQLLHELGAAEAMISDPAALEHLRAAYAAADREHKPGIAVEAAQVMVMGLRVDAAATFLERALEDADPADREARLRLTATLFTARLVGRKIAPLPVEVPSGKTPGERALLASLAMSRMMCAEPTEGALALARAAWSDGRLLADEGPDSTDVLGAIMTAVMCDLFEEASEWLAAVLADAQRRGSVTGFLTALMARAYLRYRRGDLNDAVADASAALETEAAQEASLITPGALAFLIETLIETGDLEKAEAALSAHGWDGPIPEAYPLDVLLDRRGRLRLAQGDLEGGLTDLLEARRRLAWIGNPIANLDSQAGLALATLGRREEARKLVTRELELARRVGLPRQIAIALRAAALIDRPPDTAALQESAELAALAGARLEQARALADLGAALRRTGQRAAAREPLRRALALSTHAGATVLADRAREELLAAGARPRRVMLSGREALTPSELRIAELAAAGQANREIAQGLFVTVRTVEMHLSAAYRKLGITSRAELAQALARPEPHAADTPSVAESKSFGRST